MGLSPKASFLLPPRPVLSVWGKFLFIQWMSSTTNKYLHLLDLGILLKLICQFFSMLLPWCWMGLTSGGGGDTVLGLFCKHVITWFGNLNHHHFYSFAYKQTAINSKGLSKKPCIHSGWFHIKSWLLSIAKLVET